MPPADQDSDYGKPTRTFLYGPDKTKKTWWALKAAEDGYNVILIDGDGGSSIKSQIPMPARKRIQIIDVTNTTTRNAFPLFMATFFKGLPFIWDEQAKVSLPPTHALKKDHSHYYINPGLLTPNDVVVPDSWTRLASALAMEWAREKDVDLTSIDKEWDQFALMGYQSRFLDFVLEKIGTMPCHVIAIGHETVYEKFQGKGSDRKMVEQRTQPFSSTGPHAKKIGAHFSNCLRFRKISDLTFQIDAGGDEGVMGGARQLAPKKYNWNEITPGTIFKAAGLPPTGEPCKGVIWLAPGKTIQDLVAEINTTSAAKPQEAPLVAAPAPVVNAATANEKVSIFAKLKTNV